ncbi:unnamed protein product [Cylindrotheca closterium]|uniref:Uncharacterized protein n=1 Tax=Cylindrotheca closterium TaxID=2856 RepID=A0AAD2PXV9_9STRA|nr:unnamed protein product [Cylindrotheca closterium]
MLKSTPFSGQMNDNASMPVDDSIETFTCSTDTSVLIPKRVKQLTIMNPSSFELPIDLCKELRFLLEVILPDGLREIGKSAFEGCILLRHVEIPDTVEIINDESFQDCKSISEMDLPGGLKKLGRYAFCRCVSLIKIKVPSGVEVVGECCFYLCKALVEVCLEEGVREIGRAAIYHCSSLEHIQFPSTVERIGKSALSVCASLVDVNLPLGLKALDDDCVRGCALLERFTMPRTIVSIGEYGTFRQCPRLIHVDLSEGLRVIPKCAFWECYALSTIKIPGSVEVIEHKAFKDCRSLVEVEFMEGLRMIGQQAFMSCLSLSAVTIPPTLNRLEFGAFENCTSLVSVEFPSRMGNIAIALDLFRGCQSLVNVIVSLSIRRYNTHLSANWFSGCFLIQDVLGKYNEVDGLKRRFQYFPIHRLCYYASKTTVEDLNEAFKLPYGVEDWFQMTPFHVLLSSAKPRMDLLQVLFDVVLKRYSATILGTKDRKGKRALDYLVSKWNEETKQMASAYLQKWMMERLFQWGSIQLQMNMHSRVRAILEEEDHETRNGLLQELYCIFGRCEFQAGVSYLELGVWNKEVTGARFKGVKRAAMDREICRIQCGSSCIIPNVIRFL